MPLLMLICCLLSWPAWAGTLAERFTSELRGVPPSDTLALEQVQRLDRRLIAPDTLSPAWGNYSVRQLQALYRYEQECAAADPLPLDWQPFMRALCGQQAAPSAAWFAAHPVYPLGGSSAALWQARHPDTPLGELHVRERRDALALLGQLGDDNLDALLRGERLLLEGDVLWLLHDQQWQRYAPTQWQTLAQRQGIVVAVQGTGPCEDVVSGLCINTRAPAGWQWLAVTTTLACALLLAWALWQRWRLQRERRVALQMLAHELRTPIGFLAGVAEELRADFDSLPPSAQQSVGRLLSGVARLHRLAQASRDYLSADTFTAERVAVNLREWLELMSERYGASLTLTTDMTLDLPFYWLDLALDNVLRNAQQHGAAPIAIEANWAQGRLSIAVRDSGGMARYRLDHLQNRGAKGGGLGLGLTIVRHVLKRLGGRLTLSGPPTCFTITLPCQPSAGEPA